MTKPEVISVVPLGSRLERQNHWWLLRALDRCKTLSSLPAPLSGCQGLKGPPRSLPGGPGPAWAGLGFADPVVSPPLSLPAVGTHGRGEAREPLLLPGGPWLGLRVPGRST